jgi:hypothetical protein
MNIPHFEVSQLPTSPDGPDIHRGDPAFHPLIPPKGETVAAYSSM